MNIIGQIARVFSSIGFINLAARKAYESQYVLAPILLKNGIAEEYPEKVMSILQLTQQNGYPTDINGYFGYFSVVNGGTFMQNTTAQYPFANQYTAANSIVRQPNNASLLMNCPVSASMPLNKRQGIFQSLRSSLDQHIAKGGLFVVYTPLMIFDNCLLLSMRDGSGGDNAILQNGVIFDFQQPQILTEADAEKAQSSTMSKLSTGAKI